MTIQQDDFLDPTPAQDADQWMHSPGGRHVMKDLYAIAASFVSDWKRYGIPVSVDYVCGIERHRIKCVRAWLQKRGHTAPRSHGYTINNTYTASIARHIMAHRPDWEGIFEKRELHDKNEKPKRAVFVKEAIVVKTSVNG